jgi:hypothetical protein
MVPGDAITGVNHRRLFFVRRYGMLGAARNISLATI